MLAAGAWSALTLCAVGPFPGTCVTPGLGGGEPQTQGRGTSLPAEVGPGVGRVAGEPSGMRRQKAPWSPGCCSQVPPSAGDGHVPAGRAMTERRLGPHSIPTRSPHFQQTRSLRAASAKGGSRPPHWAVATGLLPRWWLQASPTSPGKEVPQRAPAVARLMSRESLTLSLSKSTEAIPRLLLGTAGVSWGLH